METSPKPIGPQPQPLTLFQEDSHASPFPKPGSEEAKQMTVTSGLRCLKLSAPSGPLGLLAKTLLGSSEWGSTMRYLTWKLKVTKRGRTYYQLVPSEPATEETGFSLLPTPTVNGNNNHKGLSKKSGDGLATVVRMLPTPVARDYKGPNSPAHLSKPRGHRSQLPNYMAMNGLKLQPEFVEWLMGYPEGWTGVEEYEP